MMLRGAGRQLALLFADIDDFKRVNDTLGHEAGDEVLVQFANRIRGAVERLGGDEALLARFGGDEFVILIQNGDVRAAATGLAEALVQELGQPLVVEGRQVFLGTSIGITLFPEDASGATALMKNGDIAHVSGQGRRQELLPLLQPRHGPGGGAPRAHGQELRGAWNAGSSAWSSSRSCVADNRIVGPRHCCAGASRDGLHSTLGILDVAEQSGLIEAIGHACCGRPAWRHRVAVDR